MGLDVADCRSVDARIGERLFQERLLGQQVGRGQAGGAAVLVDGGPGNDGPDSIPIAHGLAEALEQQDAAPLPADEAVGQRIKCLAPPVGSHRLGARRDRHRFGGEDEVDAAAKRQVALTAAQGPRRQMDRRQRRGAGRIDDERGTLQTQRIGDAAGRDA